MLEGLVDDNPTGETGTPEWWLQKLCKAQKARLGQLRRLDAYYEGDHPLEFATEQFREAFGGLFREFSDNWCESVVNATAERLEVTGFRFGDTKDADADAWRIWQANGLDTESGIAHTEALVLAECYALVWPDEERPDTPRVTIEHPTQMIAAAKATDRRQVAAALKWYVDDEGFEVAYLYLPETVHRYRSATKTRSGLRDWSSTRWVPDDRDNAEDPAEQPNPVAPTVPVVRIQNRPRLVKPPRSEIANVIPLQDATNKLFADMMVASEFAADAQRYMLGWEPDLDPKTNQPLPPPWKKKDRLWFVPQTESDEHPVQVGQFEASDLNNYIQAIELVVNHIASQTRTPPHYLSPSADRLSGESVKASESGLISKVKQRMIPFGEAWEQVLRLCFKLLGDPRADFAAAQTIWADPELRSDAELADAAMKRKALGLPMRPVLEFLQYTPTEIERIESELATDALFAPTPEPPPVPVPA